MIQGCGCCKERGREGELVGKVKVKVKVKARCGQH